MMSTYKSLINDDERYKCRYCEIKLDLGPFPLTSEKDCKDSNEVVGYISFWGDYVCSSECENSITRSMHGSMDNHNQP